MNRVAPLLLPLGAMAIAIALDLPLRLGAHPWWSDTVLYIGVPLGLALAAGLWWLGAARSWRLVAFVILCGAALSLAHLGKARFAASFAEDTLAGRFWYVGWIATCAFGAAALASFPLRDRESR